MIANYHTHTPLCRHAQGTVAEYAQAAVAQGLEILEINMHGLDCRMYYPRPRFWEIAGEKGCDVVIGVDVHSPKALGDTETESRAREIVILILNRMAQMLGEDKLCRKRPTTRVGCRPSRRRTRSGAIYTGFY